MCWNSKLLVQAGEAGFNKGKGSMDNEKPIVIKFPDEPNIENRDSQKTTNLWHALEFCT